MTTCPPQHRLQNDRILGQLSETTKMHGLSRLAGDDELENIMPCYTGHSTVERSDGNCRKVWARTLLRSTHPRNRRVEDKPSPSVGLSNDGHDGAKPLKEVSCRERSSLHSKTLPPTRPSLIQPSDLTVA